MAIKMGKKILSQKKAEDTAKLKGDLGKSQNVLEACAKRIVGQAEDMSMSEAIKLCRKK